MDNGLVAVSIIIRTKDRPELLEQAIRSVVDQSYRPLELVVVNDGGADIEPLLKNWLALDTDELSLNLIQHKQSVGRAQAANVGLQAANSPFSIFLDDDDFFDVDHVEHLVKARREYAKPLDQLVAIHCQARAVHIDEVGEEHLLSITGHELAENQLYYQNSLPILTVLLPTSVRELGVWFDTQFDLFEDWDFWLQVYQVCELHFVEHASCAYRIHDAGSGVRDETRQHLAFKQIYAKWLPTLNDEDRLTMIANSHQWHEDDITRIQARNSAELDRIGAMHTHALATIQAKDGDIEHLNNLLTNAQQRYDELEGSRMLNYWRKISRLLAFAQHCKKPQGRKLFTHNIEEYMNHPIDVIVPVYRGLQDVIDCLDSIKASHNKQPYELILIDDCSPEPEVSALLRERAALGEYTLLVNEENLGFVATVNRGMQLHPERDVLLLNSDTLVVNDWLDRMTKAAYADERIGTVTPFSNNATICSYPDFCQDNDLASNTPLSLLDDIVANANSGKAVDVPSGVGFCMYIRRACLNDLGYFDVETFGKGYGEENDFCQRAIKAGWKNRFALDTFVQHTGNVSFGDEHNELKHTALGKLLKRHPSYDVDVQRHIAEDPAKSARVRTWLASLRFGSQPIVVHVSHNRGGGTIRFIEELSQDISGHCYSLMLMPSIKKPGHLVLTRVTHGKEALATEESEYSLYFESHSQQELLQDVLSQLPLAGFHFHHMIGLPHWVMSLPIELSQPWLVTLHDYYFIHESISLTNDQGVYLTADSLKIDSAWTHSFYSLLNGAKACLAPSEACRTIYADVFPDANIVTQYHEAGRFLNHEQYPVHGLAAPSDAPLKVVVIGALSKIKGADLLEDVARHCAKQGLNIEFELIGYGYRELQGKPKTTLSVSGRYQESDLVEMLKSRHSAGNADLVWFTALWPETYSYTLSATIEAGLPIIAPDIGAFAERLYGRAQSWITPWQNTTEQMIDIFRALLNEGSEASVLKPLISQQPPAQQHTSYQENYLQLMRQNESPVKMHTLDNQSLLLWLSQTQPLTNSELTTNQRLRRKALYGLFRLRQAPLMRAIAKRIPISLQRRIRDRLMR